MIDLDLPNATWLDSKSLKRFFDGVAQVMYHVLLVALSAGIALSLPLIVALIGKDFWGYWSIIERENIYLISVEIVTAVMLLLFFNYIARSWRDRKTAKMATRTAARFSRAIVLCRWHYGGKPIFGKELDSLSLTAPS
ncbi:MAG: hypothetical protein ACM3TN_07245 [Alphaproteobacteria bacterium]